MSQDTIGFAGDRQQDSKARSKHTIERFFTPEFRKQLPFEYDSLPPPALPPPEKKPQPAES